MALAARLRCDRPERLTPLRALVYCRVSTDAQERDGTSLDTQEQAAIEAARRSGYSVTETVRDTASGFTLERSGIEHVRRLLRAGAVDIVLSYAVDRLSRNQNHIGVLFDEVARAGARLEFVTEDFADTAIGRFIVAARAFTAEVEREKIAERTMRGKAERARRGKLPQGTGKGMYGYAYDPKTGTRQIVEARAAVVRRIFEAFVAGRTCNGIANDLKRDSVPAFSGGRWHALTVRRLLKNAAFVGRTIYRRTRVDHVRDVERGRWTRRVVERDQAEWIEVAGATPAIIDQGLFDAAQKILDDPSRRPQSAPSDVYLLRGRISCRECGARMVGHAANRGRYRYYRCPNGSSGPGETTCDSRYIRIERLEGAWSESTPWHVSRRHTSYRSTPAHGGQDRDPICGVRKRAGGKPLSITAPWNPPTCGLCLRKARRRHAWLAMLRGQR